MCWRKYFDAAIGDDHTNLLGVKTQQPSIAYPLHIFVTFSTSNMGLPRVRLDKHRLAFVDVYLGWLFYEAWGSLGDELVNESQFVIPC